MDYPLHIFKAVGVIFAISALITGIQAIVDPIGFSKFFGLPLSALTTDSADTLNGNDGAVTASQATKFSHSHHNLTMSYISLMGVRQLATGIILLTFAYQNKWTEVATILVIIGILVAGTDGIYLSRAGKGRLGRLHAIPGALIAALAGGALANL